MSPELQLSSNSASSNVVQSINNNGGGGLEAGEKPRDPEAEDEFIAISIRDPHRVGDGMSSYTVYDVHTKTNANVFRRKEMKTGRRFSDFLGLHDKLSEKYLQNGRVIPPPPDKSVVGMTKAKMDDHDQMDEFVERRRAALERFMNRIAAHPSLKTDPDFRDFLQLETELPKANQTSALSGKSVIKLISKVGDKMVNMTVKMEETDTWFEEKTAHIDRLEANLRKLHSSTELLCEHRRNLGVNTGMMARALQQLSSTEENQELALALARLSGVQEKIEKVHADQAAADFYQLSELIKDYVGLVSAVKDAFQERIRAWQAWQSATSALTRKREAKVKAELQHRTERMSGLRQEIAEAERQQEMAQENFERISRLIKKEVEQFEVRRSLDFKTVIVKYMEAMLKCQENIAREWETFLPQVAASDNGN